MIVLPEDKIIIEMLPENDAKQLLLALFSTDGDMPELSSLANMAYTVLKMKDERFQKNKEEFSELQSTRGKNGGAPRGNRNAAKQPETTQNNPDCTKQPESSPNNPNQPETSHTDTDTDTDTEKNNKSVDPPAIAQPPVKSLIPLPLPQPVRVKQAPFKPPEVAEVRAYCAERGNGIDPEYFVDYNTARGWILSNGKKTVDWRASVRTWERNKNGGGTGGNRGNTGENHGHEKPGGGTVYGNVV